MSKSWIKLVEHKTDNAVSVSKLWNGVRVWIERPHLVNRKLLATELLQIFHIPHSWGHISINFNEDSFNYFLDHIFQATDLNQPCDAGTITQHRPSVINENENTRSVLLCRKLIPRNLSKFSEVLEVVLIDEKQNVIIFWPKQSDVDNSSITVPFPYRFLLDDNRIVIELYSETLSTKQQISEKWLKTCVLPKIIKWSCFRPTESVVLSLSLVSVTRYNTIYNYLKEKYAKRYVEVWPECSDPLKYVYEDVAIAAYLMTMWEKERNDLNLPSKQTFVDLGCGNGLLVDLLTSEGHVGIGIDVRKRKIWDLYDKSTTLVEKAIEPSCYNMFPNYDWIIGNHSDELTAWIPVIAARSSYKMKVFLLPCCAYTFNGKYQLSTPGKSQYQSYLSFIHTVCETMGFFVHKDRLRIPSTKRLCFVCTSRNYKEEEEEFIDIRRKDFIVSHSRKDEFMKWATDERNTHSHASMSNETQWIADFKPRDKVEVVKNCSQLDRKFVEATVLTVVNLLLQTKNYISLERGSESIAWNAGGKIKFSELIQKMDHEILKNLKNQSGGFQTFLRNHRNVFQIMDGDVQLNVPVKGILLNSKPARKRKRRKSNAHNFQEKPCFFFFHHPQGCPLEENDCNFSHKST